MNVPVWNFLSFKSNCELKQQNFRPTIKNIGGTQRLLHFSKFWQIFMDTLSFSRNPKYTELKKLKKNHPGQILFVWCQWDLFYNRLFWLYRPFEMHKQPNQLLVLYEVIRMSGFFPCSDFMETMSNGSTNQKTTKILKI